MAHESNPQSISSVPRCARCGAESATTESLTCPDGEWHAYVEADEPVPYVPQGRYLMTCTHEHAHATATLWTDSDLEVLGCTVEDFAARYPRTIVTDLTL